MTRVLWVAALLLAATAANAHEGLSEQQLNYGYASLYNSVKGLRHSDKIFLFKHESEAVEAVIKDLSDSMGRITAGLEELAQADARLRLDDDGLPVVEQRKRDAVTRDRLLSFKPIRGRTGKNFERTLLLSESGALNQLQFLVQELDEADPDPRRSAFLRKTHREMKRVNADVVGLLEREHFRRR